VDEKPIMASHINSVLGNNVWVLGWYKNEIGKLCGPCPGLVAAPSAVTGAMPEVIVAIRWHKGFLACKLINQVSKNREHREPGCFCSKYAAK
jgi:hypothetical protein